MLNWLFLRISEYQTQIDTLEGDCRKLKTYLQVIRKPMGFIVVSYPVTLINVIYCLFSQKFGHNKVWTYLCPNFGLVLYIVFILCMIILYCIS